jgi:hypothetical protein
MTVPLQFRYPVQAYICATAVRAWHRGLTGVKLSSRKGISCSQFVTYCFQATSLHAALHNMSLQSQEAKDIQTPSDHLHILDKYLDFVHAV